MTITPSPRIGIIVVAAGSGTRLGVGVPKAFVGIDEHSMLRHSLRGVFQAPLAQVVIVAPAGREGEALTEAHEAAGERRDLVTVATGGSSRQESVAAGLAGIWPGIEVVLVHDAARALTPADVFERVIAAVERTGWGIVPTVPMVDTIKRVEGERIIGNVDRAELSAAQTPQGFRREILDASYAVAAEEFTDEGALVAAAGHAIGTVEGHPLSFKITTTADLERACALVTPVPAVPGPHSPPELVRVGIGTDVHAFASSGVLWLAGLEWPGEPSLAGHSDGDAVAHAIVDALLSAAGLGDIGTHFGTDRPEYAGAHADRFLARTRAVLAEAGFTIGNVSVQVQAVRPRFGARREEAQRVLSAALGGAPVTVSATTTDGLGFPGRGDGVQAFAVAAIKVDR